MIKTLKELFQGSILENRILEDDFGVESISTAKLFCIAKNTGVTILTIDQDNIETILPTLVIADNIKEDITNSVNQGLIVKIPEHEIVYEDWTGAGYIKENIETGESGWMLSGMIAGSMTVWGVERWDDSIIAILINAYSEPANQDPESGRYIRKIPSTDFQPGTVGEKLPKALQVIVEDEDKHRVYNAEVIFTVNEGGGTLKAEDDTSPGEGKTRITVRTDYYGYASVNLILGEKTSTNPTMWWKQDYTYAMQVGENIVDARLKYGLKIAEPFTAFGFPTEDKTKWKIRMTYGEEKYASILSWAGPVILIVEDNYQNPISNVPITFTSGNVEPRDDQVCDYSGQSFKNAKLLKGDEDCMANGMPVLGQCGSDVIEKTTHSKGAYAQVIAGSRPEGKYPIKATSDGLDPVTFNIYTDYLPCATSYCSLVMITSYASDWYGNSIDAGKVGTKIPMKVKCYFLITEDSGESSIDYGEDVSVKFGDVAAEPMGNGLYKGMYTLENDPKINRVRVDCTATPTKGPDAGETFSDYMRKYVYGVKIETKPEHIVPVDENGYVTWDTKIRYEIKPSEYQASTAYVAIFKGNDQIAYITSDIKGAGFGALSRGFEFDRNSSYQAQVVLNPGTGVEIKGEKVPITFVELKMAVEEKDTVNFPDVELRWDDYYPALGAKTITILGEKNPGSINGMKVRCEVDPPIEGVTIITPEADFDNGKVQFQLSAPSSTVPKTGEGDALGIDEIQLKFTLLNEEELDVIELFEVWNVKNNSNTNLKEVLEGKAVFIYDASDNEHNVGHTENWNAPDIYKEFDVVQELFNQVIPRKRSVFNPGNYELMDENGIFDFKAKNALALFKEHFKVDNTTAGSDFKKLEKDYSSVDSRWANQIIGKKILMGKNDGDDQINASTAGDTGLYELYDNVVKVFVKKIIEEANKYAGSEPTDNWWSRTGEGPETETLDDHGPGMSYCYGGKNSIGEFNSQDNGVSKCMPETNIDERENDPLRENYRGNINENIIDENYYCAVGSGNKKWPGLLRDEWNVWNAYHTSNPGSDQYDHPFHPQHWAGIDCSGLVQRATVYSFPGVNVTISINNGVKRVSDIFESTETKNLLFYFSTDSEKYIKKGDLVRYGNTHVSTVYSDRPTDAGHYEIIHAYGIPTYTYPDHAANSGLTVFSRKVLKTWENTGSPTGFGRIKLWQ